MAFRMPLDRAAAPHMVQITEIAVILFSSFALMPPLYQSRCPEIGTLLGEAKKVDAAWSDIFGTAENQIVQ